MDGELYTKKNDFHNASIYFEMAANVHPAKEFYINAGLSRYKTGNLLFTNMPYF